MKTVRGKTYMTMADAATKLEISISTLRRYIKQKKVKRPKTVFFGTQSVAVFEPRYLEDAKAAIIKIRSKNDRDSD